MKQSIAALLLAVLVLLPACGAQPVPEAPWQTACRETGAYLQTQGAPTAGSIGGEWAVIGLSRAGLLSTRRPGATSGAWRITCSRRAPCGCTTQNPPRIPAPSWA